MIRSKLGVCPQDVLPPITNQTCMAYNTLHLKQRSSDNGSLSPPRSDRPYLYLPRSLSSAVSTLNPSTLPLLQTKRVQSAPSHIDGKSKIQTQIQWRFPGTRQGLPFEGICVSDLGVTAQMSQSFRLANKQTNTLTNKQTHKQTGKQTNTEHTGKYTCQPWQH